MIVGAGLDRIADDGGDDAFLCLNDKRAAGL